YSDWGRKTAIRISGRQASARTDGTSRRAISAPAAKRKRSYHGFVDKRWLRERIALAPPMLIDVSLALVLGLIGAAQLISDRHPFGEPRGGPRPGPGPGPGPGPFPRSHEPLDYVFLGLCAGFLVLRRRSPFIALAGATAF